MLVPEVILQRRLTFEDYQKLPDDLFCEIIKGELYVAPRARPKHQIAVNNLAVILTIYTRGRGTVIPDADLIVQGRDVYVAPDIMYFAGDRFAAVNPDDWIRIIPDLIVEVLSPSSEDYDLRTKRQTYAELGVPHYWAVNARTRAIVEHVLDASGRYHEQTIQFPERFRPALFPDLEIDLGQVFP